MREKKMIGNIYVGKREFEAIEIGFVFNKNFGKTDTRKKVVWQL